MMLITSKMCHALDIEATHTRRRYGIIFTYSLFLNRLRVRNTKYAVELVSSRQSQKVHQRMFTVF
jgi:hypothetical protein